MCTESLPLRAKGFSLIELVVFIVIVSIALVGTLAVLDLTSARSADAMQRKQALAIGEAFLDEILSREYSNPTVYPTSPPTDPRSAYADVDDYNLYSATGITTRGPVAAAIPGLGAYRVGVAVAGPAPVTGVPMKQITVTVTDPAGNAYQFTAFKAGY